MRTICALKVVIAEFVLMYHFTGFFICPVGPIPGASRNQEKPDEEHEARPAPAPCNPDVTPIDRNWRYV